ncbi:hypothetical protein PIROE2DRAFT_43261, partial [Piromyces sp. E2]
NYGIVVDAGSSGSRVQIYSWRDTNYLQTAYYQHNLTFSQLDGVNDDGLPLIEKGIKEGNNWQYKIDRGISTFKDAPEEVGPKHIKLLMDPILNIIPAEKINSTPVYIYATAGMRLLKENERNAILSEACSYLKKNYNFLVKDCDKQIVNISGEEEGLYGWLGLNYLKNGFSSSSSTMKKSNNQNIIPSYGVLDMGGASTQIAYDISSFIDKPSKEENVIKTELHKITGEKTTYNVYSTTFLGFGMNETRRRYLEALLNTKTSGKYYELIVNDPCLPVDSKQNEFKPVDLLALGKDYEISDWRIDVKGTGDLDKCLADVYPLLNKTEPCKKEPCLFNGVHTPVKDFSKMPFYGISEYWYTSHDVHKQGGAYNYDKFYNAAKNLCKTDWNKLDKNYKDGQYSLIYDEYLLFLSCFRSAWVMTVLHDGMGITKKSTFDKRDHKSGEEDSQIQEDIKTVLINTRAAIPQNDEKLVPFTTINEYNGYQVSWTLGVILKYICSTVSESLDNIEFGNGKKFTFAILFLGLTSIFAMVTVVGLILYIKFNNQRLQYTEILPMYDNSNGNKLKNRYREVISLENITSNMPKIKPSENFNSARASNSTIATNPKITNIITKEIPFRVNSDLQQYLSGEGTPNELKRVNSFTAMKMKKDTDLV